MANLIPFGLDPAINGLEPFTAYWYTALCHASYFATTPNKLALWQLGGVTSLQTVTIPGQVLPQIDLGFFAGNRAIVVVQGTRFFSEMIRQAIGAVLVDLPQWPGLVGNYWSSVTLQLWDALLPVLQSEGVTELALAGHSQGGGIVQLLSQLVTDEPGVSVTNLCTVGAPRTGNVTYAQTQTAKYLRLTNTGDPVPAIPAAVSTPLELFLWLIPSFDLNSYTHWGTRFHLFQDGSVTQPPELPSWLHGSEALLRASLFLNSWFGDHATVEYARRLRINLPGPAGSPNPGYPGLVEIDNYFAGVPVTPPTSEWFDPETCV